MAEMEELRELKRMVADTMRLSITSTKNAEKRFVQVEERFKMVEERFKMVEKELGELRKDITLTNKNLVVVGESVKSLHQTVDAYIKGVRNGGKN